MNALQKLRQLVDDIRAADPLELKKDEWALAGRLLGRMPGADPAAVSSACKSNDIEALDAIVAQLEHPQAPPPRTAAPKRDVPEEELHHAMNLFKKRLRLARLADESKLGGRRLTGGRKSEIDAIIPPQEIPQEVWDALVDAGKLEHTGEGFYAIRR